AARRDFDNEFIAENAAGSSDGIDMEGLDSSAGDTKLSGRTTTKVTSKMADKILAKKKASAKKQARRSEREIEQVFQRNKGVIYSIYNRALRKDPTLAGKVIVELTISPDGTITQCQVVSSELNAPALEKKIVARIKLFRFKPARVIETTVQYPIDFLPS
ncbi:MAG: TonB family protein, partial [Gammaproteobacteria bacterium]|nr:TonB family protein [Gammaproteobacteria bacterium]